MLWGFAIIFLSFVADQLSKSFAAAQIPADNPVFICDYFNLVKVWNTGVSFSMFNGYGDVGNFVLSATALVIAAVLLYWMFQEKNKIKIAGLGLIVGGALGNVVDRLHFGAVLDFLDFHYKSNHWPAFNLADSFICIGAFLLIALEIFYGKKKGAEDAEGNQL